MAVKGQRRVLVQLGFVVADASSSYVLFGDEIVDGGVDPEDVAERLVGLSVDHTGVDDVCGGGGGRRRHREGLFDGRLTARGKS